MPDEFDGKVALVTGGAGGAIGAPTARRFAEEGGKVVICDVHERRNRETADVLREQTGAEILDFHLDVADRRAVDDMLEETEKRLGPVDILINNAAENVLGPIRSYDPETWDRIIDVDLTACFYLIRRVFPGMLERRSGNILNISSVAGWIAALNPARGEAPYACAKAALHELPAAQSEVILLHEIEGLTCREIVQITGDPLGTVNSRLFRALKRLREIL